MLIRLSRYFLLIIFLLSLSPSVCLFICFLCLFYSHFMFVRSYFYLFVTLNIFIFIFLSVSVSVCLSIYLSFFVSSTLISSLSILLSLWKFIFLLSLRKFIDKRKIFWQKRICQNNAKGKKLKTLKVKIFRETDWKLERFHTILLWWNVTYNFHYKNIIIGRQVCDHW